jgi:hypothetical protein
MHTDVVTAVSEQQWQAWAQRAVATWQRQPTIYRDSELDQDPQWREWRLSAREREGPDFAHTAVRFSYKVQAQCHHFQSRRDKYMIWLDADVTQTQTCGDRDWFALMPWDRESITFLDRQPRKYAETGWIAYRRDADSARLLARLAQVYLSGEIWQLEQWHDAFVWDHVRMALNTPSRSLRSAGAKTPDPFGDSSLAPWFRHHKGPRKSQI